MNLDKVWMVFTMLLFVVVVIVTVLFLSANWAEGALPPDPKGGGYATEPQGPQEKAMMPADHPHAVSEGQWIFWGKVVGGICTFAASAVGGYALVRSKKRKREGKEK